MKFVAVFPSIHYVLKAEKLLKAKGIPTELVPIPREISSDCGMALAFPEDPSRLESLFNESGLQSPLYFLREGEAWRPLFRNSKQE